MIVIKEKMCLRQLKRPEVHIHLKGVGDCTKCTPDDDNQYCKLYTPITLVKESKND